MSLNPSSIIMPGFSNCLSLETNIMLLRGLLSRTFRLQVNANLLEPVVYVINDFLFLSDKIERSTVHFDAHSISKPDSSSSLIELDEESEETEVMTPSQDIVDAIVCEFRQRLNLKLFGIDVIIEKESGRHAIIDVNVFPGKAYGRIYFHYFDTDALFIALRYRL